VNAVDTNRRIGQTDRVLLAQLSDIHVGGGRYRPELLRASIEEVNAAKQDLVVVAGDLTDDGYADEYSAASAELRELTCPRIIMVPGNHDARNVGYLRFEDTFGPRDSRLRAGIDGMNVSLVAVDSSKPDLNEGEIGREHYAWIEEGFAEDDDLRIFVCHHRLMPIPWTGRESNQVLDAGDVLFILRQCDVDIVLSGHRHVPWVWPVAGMLLVHSGTTSTLRTRGFTHPAYNLVRVDAAQIVVEVCIAGGEHRPLGTYPRRWPDGLSGRHQEFLVWPPRGIALADDRPTPRDP
jgi:3',5'-cyclic-AMP phosphodiesterase